MLNHWKQNVHALVEVILDACRDWVTCGGVKQNVKQNGLYEGESNRAVDMEVSGHVAGVILSGDDDGLEVVNGMQKVTENRHVWTLTAEVSVHGEEESPDVDEVVDFYFCSRGALSGTRPYHLEDHRAQQVLVVVAYHGLSY